jgi:hypothetical protein
MMEFGLVNETERKQDVPDEKPPGKGGGASEGREKSAIDDWVHVGVVGGGTQRGGVREKKGKQLITGW